MTRSRKWKPGSLNQNDLWSLSQKKRKTNKEMLLVYIYIYILFILFLFLNIPSVERRRRDKINNWIVTLSKIIPDCNMDSTKTGAVSTLIWLCTAANLLLTFNSVTASLSSQSKGGILSKACDYIRELRQSNQRLQESLKEVERIQMDNELCRQQVWISPSASAYKYQHQVKFPRHQ